MGQNAEVMPRPLNSSIVIYSLEFHIYFSVFVLEKHMLGFAQIIFCISYGVEICPCRCGIPGIWKRFYHFVLFYPSIRSKSSQNMIFGRRDVKFLRNDMTL